MKGRSVFYSSYAYNVHALVSACRHENYCALSCNNETHSFIHIHALSMHAYIAMIMTG